MRIYEGNHDVVNHDLPGDRAAARITVSGDFPSYDTIAVAVYMGNSPCTDISYRRLVDFLVFKP